MSPQLRLDKTYSMVVFDAGGTLVTADWTRVSGDLATAAADHGLRLETEDLQQSLRDTLHEVYMGIIPDRADSPEAVADFWHHLLARTLSRAAGVRSGAPYLRGAWETARAFYPRFDGSDYHCLIDGAHETLTALASAGFRLGLLSNWSPTLPTVLQRLGIRHHFEIIIVSSLVGLSKPGSEIFHLAAQRSGCQPGQLLYVGDNPGSDIAGSQAAGWDAVLVSRRGRTRGMAVHAQAEIENVAALPALLGIK